MTGISLIRSTKVVQLFSFSRLGMIPYFEGMQNFNQWSFLNVELNTGDWSIFVDRFKPILYFTNLFEIKSNHLKMTAMN
jgi:hypothetical protein